MRGMELRHDAPEKSHEHQTMVMDACWSMAVGQSMVDTIAGADFHARHLLLALDAGDNARLARALALEAAHISAQGVDGHERALELLDRAEKLGLDLGDPHAYGLAKLMRGGHAMFVASYRQAVKLIEEAVAMFRNYCTNVAWELATARRWVFSTLYFKGDLLELRRQLPAALADARARGDRFAESCVRSGSSVAAWLSLHDIEQARHHLQEEAECWGDERFALQHYLTLQGMSIVDLYAAQPNVAAERMAGDWRRLEKSMLMRVQLLRVSIIGLRARVCLASGDQRTAEKDIKRLRREGLASASAKSTLLEACYLLYQRDKAGALESFRRAARALEQIDMRLLACGAHARIAELSIGDEAATSRAQVDAYMQREQIANPEALLQLIVPRP